jgi:hypothetical protein
MCLPQLEAVYETAVLQPVNDTRRPGLHRDLLPGVFQPQLEDLLPGVRPRARARETDDEGRGCIRLGRGKAGKGLVTQKL